MPSTSLSTRRVKAPSQELSDSQFERILGNAAKLSIVLIGLVVLLVALQAGQVILAPVLLAIVIGLMFGPVADFVERHGVHPALSALVVVLLLLGTIIGGLVLFAVPLSEWVARGPVIWQKLHAELLSWKEPLAALGAIQEQVSGVFGTGTAMPVTVQDSSAVTNFALIFPAIGAQVLIFLASLYFFVATRDHIRISVLSLCVTRRMRWRTAHIFNEVEVKVSRFLLSVTFINLCVGTAVSLAMWAIGMPSPILWGAMAAVLNYIPYVGQGLMTLVLVAVGAGTRNGLENILTPLACYLGINFIEGQVITPPISRADHDHQSLPDLSLHHLLDLGLGPRRRARRRAVAVDRAVGAEQYPAQQAGVAAPAGPPHRADDRQRSGARQRGARDSRKGR